MPNLEDLKRYAVVDPTSDGSVLNGCMAAAMRYFANAGVPEPAEADPLYDMGIYMLATHYYDHRGVMDENAAPIPFGVNSIINQLKY